MTRIWAALALGGMLLAGCASDYRESSADEVSQGLQVVDNEFSGSKVFMGPPVQGSAETGVRYTAKLAAAQTRSTGDVTNVLHVEFKYTNNRWMFFNAANLPGGRPLVIVPGDRNVSTCSSMGFCNYTENLSALLPLDVLTSATGGLRVSFQGTVVELPASYVIGYMQGLSGRLGQSEQ